MKTKTYPEILQHLVSYCPDNGETIKAEYEPGLATCTWYLPGEEPGDMATVVIGQVDDGEPGKTPENVYLSVKQLRDILAAVERWEASGAKRAELRAGLQGGALACC